MIFRFVLFALWVLPQISFVSGATEAAVAHAGAGAGDPPVLAIDSRIISLNPAATELLFDFGEGKNIVGASEWSDFPNAAQSIPRIGSYLRPNFEQIAKLAPTLLVYSAEGEDHISDSLKKVHAKTIGLPSRTLDDFKLSVHNLGQILNRESKAKSLIEIWNHSWADLALNPVAHEHAHQAPSILILLDTSPLIAAGPDSFVSESFARCGLQNILKDQKGYPRLSQEAAWSLHPQLVLILEHSGLGTEAAPPLHWPQKPKVSVMTIRDAELGRLSLRLPVATLKACQKINAQLESR